MKLTLLGLISYFLMADLYAETTSISSIEFDGLKRTNLAVVMDELGLVAPCEATTNEIEEAIANLRNTFIFNDVKYELKSDPSQSDSKILFISLEERWTTIPIAKFSSGGGVNHYTLGLYETNLIGNLLEVGGQYERLGDTNSGVVWFKNPNIAGSKIGLDFQVWRVNRLRTKYFQEPLDKEIKTGFLHTRDRVSIDLTKAIKSNFKTGLVIEYNNDRFSDSFVPDDVKEKLILMSLPPNTETTLLGIKSVFGRVDYNNYLVDGEEFEISVKKAYVQTKGIQNFKQTDLKLFLARTLPLHSTYAMRILAGESDTTVLQYWYYLGGLDRVRGFSDNRFAGSKYWLANFEFRIPSYRSQTFILQHTVFSDHVAAAEKMKDLRTEKGSSVGAGLRFVFPKIYRFVGRLDFAHYIVRQDDAPISFGVQQFF